PSRLEETAEAFVVVTVFSQTRDEVRTASVVWTKRSFDAWWAAVQEGLGDTLEDASAPFPFTVASPQLTACIDGRWSQVPYLRPARSRHTVVWTGSEMIIWGGWDPNAIPSSRPANTGARYNPATDTWIPTSTEGSVPAG